MTDQENFRKKIHRFFEVEYDSRKSKKVYFKNYYVTKFSSDTTPNAYTTPAPLPTSETTHPITTTVATPG